MTLMPRLPSAPGFVRDVEQSGAEAEAPELRAHRQHVHIPGARREIFQFLERHEHRRQIAADRLRLILDLIADQAPGARAAMLDDDGVVIGEAALGARGAAAADLPGALARRRHLAPQVKRQAVAGVVHQLGQDRRILDERGPQWPIERHRVPYKAPPRARLLKGRGGRMLNMELERRPAAAIRRHPGGSGRR
jgi:hypothetical protein